MKWIPLTINLRSLCALQVALVMGSVVLCGGVSCSFKKNSEKGMSAADSNKLSQLVLEAREARLASKALAVQTLQLKSQVADLTERLAQSRHELDTLRVQVDRAGMQGGAIAADPGVRLDGVKIIEINPALGMVVLDAGSERGLRVSQRFQVLRGDQSIAVIRTAEVREQITGAVVEQSQKGQFPEKGDRVIPVSSTGR